MQGYVENNQSQPLAGTAELHRVRVLLSKGGEKIWEERTELVLSYSQDLLNRSGYVVTLFLQELEGHRKECFGLYGPFKDSSGLRHHLLLPALTVMKDNLLIYDWEMLDG
jgi:hypothetical protein